MTFCHICTVCGSTFEAPHRLITHCGEPTRRDYRSENVGIGEGVRVSRIGTNADQARLFLPENKDFAGPDDPDGKKGMRKWREEYAPSAGNKHPTYPGEVDKTVFAVGAPNGS